MREDDRSYYERRAEEEELAANMASDPQSAMIHRALAARYVQLARGALDPALES